jgi:hypothetical protein
MPLVLINPVIRPTGEPTAGPKGCLVFPATYGEVLRPAEVELRAMNDRNEPFEFEAGGLLARAIQGASRSSQWRALHRPHGSETRSEVRGGDRHPPGRRRNGSSAVDP